MQSKWTSTEIYGGFDALVPTIENRSPLKAGPQKRLYLREYNKYENWTFSKLY